MNLSENFIRALTRIYSNKKELVYLISGLLNIEKESAYRRLNGKVQFTLDEMAILSKKFDISIDNLIHSEDNNLCVMFNLEVDDINGMKSLEEHIGQSMNAQSLIKADNISVGIVLDSIPIEWYAFHPHLEKFLYYEWGRIHSNTENYESFSEWEIPEGLYKSQMRYIENFQRYNKITYIIDSHFFSKLIDEIRYYKSIHVLTEEDMQMIKTDLINFLSKINTFLRSKILPPFEGIEYDVYLANFNIGVAAFYILCDAEDYYSGIKTSFLSSGISHSYDSGRKIHLWIDSLKNISTLISGSGEKERIHFIEVSRKMIESI